MSKERKMTGKGFLHKSGRANISAASFLKEYRQWLTTGNLSDHTSPILAKLDSGELLPTPCLDEIRQAVLKHHLLTEQRKAEESMSKASEPGSGGGTSKPYVATVYDAKGNVCTRETDDGQKDLVQGFENSIEAQGWCDRRLFEGQVDWHAVIVNTLLSDKEGNPFSMNVMRNDSIGRILRPKGQPSTRKVGKTSANLSSKMRAVGDRFHFSKG